MTDLRAAVAEFSRHTSARILFALWIGSALLRLGLGDWSLADALAVAVVCLYWPIQEWLIHVFILHYRPREIAGRVFDFAVPASHRAHHRDPSNARFVFIPARVFWYGPAVVFAGCFALAPTPAVAMSAATVFFLLSLHYEWVHFLIHTHYKPRSRHYLRLRRNHRLHHYKNEAYWMGVTMLSGDRLLRTAPDFRAVPTSPTCRNLAADPRSEEAAAEVAPVADGDGR